MWHTVGTPNSPKGLCRPQRASIWRKDSGRTDTKPHQRIQPQTRRRHRKREPGNGVSSTKSNISRAMRGRIPKVPNFLAIRNQQPTAVTTSHSEHHASSSSTTPAAAAQNTRTSDRTQRSPSYYGFEIFPPNSTILPPPKRPRRAGDVENYQPPPESIVE